MRYSRCLFLSVLLGGLACTYPTMALENGDIVEVGMYIYPTGAGGGYLKLFYYQCFPDPNGPYAPVPWPVLTQHGTAIPFRVLVSDDFTAEEKEWVAETFEADAELSASWRQGLPSMWYNCFAYATGYTSYWLSTVDPFVNEDWASTDNISAANRATHGGTVFLTLFDHASRVVPHTDYVCIDGLIVGVVSRKYLGKYGLEGIYETDKLTVERIYCNPTRLWIAPS